MTLTDQIAAAKRELALRKSSYPRWLVAGKITKQKADHEIEAMTAIIQTLETVNMLNEAGLAWMVQAQKEEKL